jgi:hypothetical protein
MSGPITYTFASELWLSPGKGGWWFASLPIGMSEEIRSTMQRLEGGWGRLHVSVQVGDTTWSTAIWYDTKRRTYLLPIKTHVRKQQGLESGQLVHVKLRI